jgi:hypothetical protein
MLQLPLCCPPLCQCVQYVLTTGMNGICSRPEGAAATNDWQYRSTMRQTDLPRISCSQAQATFSAPPRAHWA